MTYGIQDTNHVPQHHCILQQHKGLHGPLSLGRRSKRRRPVCATTERRLLSGHVEAVSHQIYRLPCLACIISWEGSVPWSEESCKVTNSRQHVVMAVES